MISGWTVRGYMEELARYVAETVYDRYARQTNYVKNAKEYESEIREYSRKWDSYDESVEQKKNRYHEKMALLEEAENEKTLEILDIMESSNREIDYVSENLLREFLMMTENLPVLDKKAYATIAAMSDIIVILAKDSKVDIEDSFVNMKDGNGGHDRKSIKDVISDCIAVKERYKRLVG